MSSTILINRCCEGCCTLEVLASCVNCDGSGYQCVPPGVCGASSFITTDVYGRFFVNPNFPFDPPLCYPRDSTVTLRAQATFTCAGFVYEFSSATVIKRCGELPLDSELWTSPDITVQIPSRCCKNCIVTIILNYVSGDCFSYRHRVYAGGWGTLLFPGNPWWEQGPPWYPEPSLPRQGFCIEGQDIIIMPADMDTGKNVLYAEGGDGFGVDWHWPVFAPGFDTAHKMVAYTKSKVDFSAWIIVGIERGEVNIPIYERKTHKLSADCLTFWTNSVEHKQVSLIASGPLIPEPFFDAQMTGLVYIDSEHGAESEC